MDKFALKSTPSVEREDKIIVKKEYIKVYPQSNRTGSNFASNVLFEFQNSGKQYFYPAESYMVVRLKLVGDLSGSPVLLRDTSGIYPAFNIGANFWSTYSHQINNTVVDRSDMLPQQDAINKRLNLTREAKQTWGTVSCLESNRTLRLRNSGFDISGVYQGTGIVDLEWRPSLGLFATDDVVPPSCRHLLEFVVHPDYKKRIVEATSSLTAGSVGHYDANVEEIYFMACMVNVDAPVPNGNHYINFGASEISFQSITSTTNNLFFTVKPSTRKISTFLQSSLAGTNTIFPPSKFDASGQSLNLTLVPRQTFGSSQQPNIDIDLKFDNSGAVGQETNFRRAFYDYNQASNYTTDDVGAEEYIDWRNNLGAVFTYKHDRDPSDTSTTLMVYSTLSKTPFDCNLYVYSEYDRLLNLQYSNGQCVAVMVEDI